jgi:hypothetical protein
MTCAIMQPTYFPWMGYFDMIDQADSFVFLDDVKLVRQSWMVRNRIKTTNGPVFLTIPVTKGKETNDILIKDAVIADNNPWRKKHLKTIFYEYKKSTYFEEIYPFIENIIHFNTSSLSDFTTNVIKNICEVIGIDHHFSKSSDLKAEHKIKDSRLVEISIINKCDRYLSPQGSAEYLEKNKPGGAFGGSPVKLFYHNYHHPEYKQLHGPFISHMCIIDLLFNVGFKDALGIIRSGRENNFYYTEFRNKILKTK